MKQIMKDKKKASINFPNIKYLKNISQVSCRLIENDLPRERKWSINSRVSFFINRNGINRNGGKFSRHVRLIKSDLLKTRWI